MSRTKIWYAHLLQKIIAKIGTLPLILHTLLMTNGLSELRARETSKDEKKIYFCKEAERNFVGKKILSSWTWKATIIAMSQQLFLEINWAKTTVWLKTILLLGLFLKSVFGKSHKKLSKKLRAQILWIINKNNMDHLF